MDLLQNNHWTDGGRSVCGNKSIPDHGVLHNSGFTMRFYCVSVHTICVVHHLVYYGVFYFRLIDLHFRFNLAL